MNYHHKILLRSLPYFSSHTKML